MKSATWIGNTSKQQSIEIDKKFWNTMSRKAYPVSKGKLRVPISLEPFIITKQKYQKLQRKLLLLISASMKVANKYFEDKQIKEIVALNRYERLIIDSNKNQELIGIIRVDLFYDKKPRVVEINADFPDGYFMHDVTSHTMSSLLNNNFSLVDHANIFHRLLKANGVKNTDHIFIGYNNGRSYIDEFILTKNQLIELGWKNISVGTFESLDFKNNNFYFEGKMVNVIRRGAELFKLRNIPGFILKLNTAEKLSGLIVINNFKMRLMGHKSLMAVLHDKRFHKYLTKSEIDSINYLLPKTFKLDRCDLKEVLINKNHWVLKPADLAEGEGVSIGSSLNKVAWEKAIREASKHAKNWIVQERVTIPTHKFNLVDQKNNKITSVVKNFDFCPHVVLFKDHSEMGHILVRFSESDILNVMKGGGLTYAFSE